MSIAAALGLSPGCLPNVFERDRQVETHFDKNGEKNGCIRAFVRYPPYSRKQDAYLNLECLARGGYRVAWEAPGNAGH